MKTDDLEGARLDAVVAAQCRVAGRLITDHHGSWRQSRFLQSNPEIEWSPSTNWAIAGPIIELERITVAAVGRDDRRWYAEINGAELESGIEVGYGKHHAEGATPLIAAMRAFVKSRVGDEIAD